jgi:FMN-dependent NADH-azoreductase
MTAKKILRIDSSARDEGSYSRALTDQVVSKLQVSNPGAEILLRDVANGNLPHIDSVWAAATNTPEADRSAEHIAALALSDSLVDEIISADILVIGCPIYNFSVPASLKAWIDQICRAGRTFSYSPEGPKGLLEGKKAYIIIASGGTEIDSTVDFATGYLRQVLSFIGITDVVVIESDRLMIDADAAHARAKNIIEQL